MDAIIVKNLRRVYKSSDGIIKRKVKEVVAVEDVSFEIHQGELFGLLGPNGAGKTTTVKMLTTLLIPSGGSATILDLDVVKDAGKVRPRIGFIFGGERGCIGGSRRWIICAILPACIMWTLRLPQTHS
jgi:ABC-2 type transport system ATP-binding protein